MPTYDYQCDSCGHQFELFQGINDPPETKCPACKKRKLRRLFGTGAAVMFKGSGFYQTDYRSESYKKAAAAESKASSEGSSGGKETKESKPKSDSSSSSSNASKSTSSGKE
jgi:putative FmdB family regulatory protein